MKRTKVKPKCSNPLFELWLQEWKDEAAIKGSDVQYCYSKALSSLRKYPLSLQSGKDCIILQHFGSKLCSMLDKKLEEHKKFNPVPDNCIIRSNSTSNESINDVVPKRSKISETVKSKQDCNVKKTKSASESTTNPYIPAWRSGGYAILLTMFNKMKDREYSGYMSKADLQTEAQSLCDKSLKKPDPGSRYSAWSSMSTLIARGLVVKSSNPAKYSLTDHGMAVAMQLSELHKGDSLSIDPCDSSKHLRIVSNKSKSTSTFKKKPAHSLSPDISIDREKFEVRTPESEKDDTVVHRSDSLISLDSVKDKLSAKYTNTVTAFSSITSDTIESIEIERSPRHVSLSESSRSCVRSEYLNAMGLTDYKDTIMHSDTMEERVTKVHVETNVKAIARNESKKNEKHKEKASRSSNSETNTETVLSSLINSVDETYIFSPCTFDVILLVDTQEITGGKTNLKDDPTAVELSRAKILFEIRRLSIGDFAWIARCRHTRNELILPYIVERKRMDDLSASIIDGRFHEQKFRLKQSGIQNAIYMIESYGDNKCIRTTIPLTSLLQASVNSLVQDDFTVKYTNSHRDSMLYLASLTTMLTEIYKEKRLISCRKENLVSTNVLGDVIPLMNFKEFNKTTTKVKNFNVRQMFIRQLLQLKGVSVEKALAIVEYYPTPKLLVNALCDTRSDGEKLLANIQYGLKKRNLGPAISKTIYQLYTKRVLD